ncbi:MAG: site-specific DNA-methyltransferase [Zavarzinella sp.]
MAKKKPTSKKTIETLTHADADRTNIPTAEYETLLPPELAQPKTVRYPRNTDLDPQLVWRGKDTQDWTDLVVHAPPIYIQEKVHPKVLIDDLMAGSSSEPIGDGTFQGDLFADFNGIPEGAEKTEFYQHDGHWTNRMILGDSLQVMASLAEREGLRGKVQCIYFDPPYGIKFNSNFQWSTTSRDVKDGNRDHLTREPEQVKAFRDTWRDGIHSYLTYLRDRLTVARDLLTESGSIFVQIGDENVHRVRAVMDEVFGPTNLCSVISFRKTGGQSSTTLASVADYVLWYAKSAEHVKYRQPYRDKTGEDRPSIYRMIEEGPAGVRRKMTREEQEAKSIDESLSIFAPDTLISLGATPLGSSARTFECKQFHPGSNQHWKTTSAGLDRLEKSRRLINVSTSLYYVRKLNDFPVAPMDNLWQDTSAGGYSDEKLYVVQTNRKIVQRCLLMASDPGDLVLDPTCGSGTTAYVAEQWGRRWITIDTSRVALALARARIMGGRYPYYLLADTPEGQSKEAEVTQKPVSSQPTSGSIRRGFVYERVPHITLKSIANNTEIDVIWQQFEDQLLPLREQLSKLLPAKWLADYRKKQKYDVDVPAEIQEWEIPRDLPTDWSEKAKPLHAEFWKLRIARQKAIDASIAARAEFEYLYDKPYEDKKKVRVAGPFTVESLSPHRTLGVDEHGELIDSAQGMVAAEKQDFAAMILDNLRTAGVQQAHKEGRIQFDSLTLWPGRLVCAEGRYLEGETSKRAAILIGPEFGTVRRQDLVEAAREAADAGFDVLICCAFNYEAITTEFNKLGRLPVLKARMNADLHMSEELKNTGKGNLFVIFGEPDVELLYPDKENIQVQVNGVDVFKPQTGEVISSNTDEIACWFVDSNYNGESFFVRQAYFLGANDPYKSLKTTLKAEIDAAAWETLHSATSRPFPRPATGRIAVKVINHLGDEVLKVFEVK